MQKGILRFIKRGVPSSLMILLLLVGCSNQSSQSMISNKEDDKNWNQKVERVNFNEVLKNVTIGYEENFNNSVKVSSAVSDAKQKNQEITVIIEMDGDTTLDTYLNSNNSVGFPEFYASKRAIVQENEMIHKQTDLAASLLKAGLVDEVYGNYSTLFNGFYGKTTYSRIEQIRSFANVKEAYVSTIYNKPTGVVSNDTNVDENTGIYINDTEYDGSNTIVAVLDSGFDYTHEVFNMSISRPAKTKENIENILESTVAYQLANQELTINDVYLSSKVPFAYDYADKKADVFPIESDHGTHVSGIIGGKSDQITGIAPNTQFAWMKVFNDDDGGGDTADIVCALEDAVALGVDAINLSLGAVGGYSAEVIPNGEANSLEERINTVYSKIEEVGISLLTAAGNEYSSGYQSDSGTNLTTNPESGTISSPGSYPASLTVASINGVLDPYALINHSDTEAVFFKNGFDSKQVEHKFIEELFEKINRENLPRNADGSVDIEYVTVPGYGAKVNYTGINVRGKIALVKRGSTSFEEKLKQAYAAGAFAVLIYNNVSGSLSIQIGDEAYIPISLISLEAGTKLASKKSGVLTFKEDYAAGPFMSDFSSWGPLADLTLKPEITAHGGNIYSSILGGSYDTMSGTSMATPNTCGIVLVIRDYVKATWPELQAKQVTQMVNRLLMSTATICLNEIGNPYSPRKQGAGLASLLNSITTDAYLYVDGIDKTKLELGDDKNKTGIYECNFNVKNISNQALTYTIGNYTMTETVSSDDKAVAEMPYMLSPSMAIKVGDGLTLEGDKVTIPANSDASIQVTLTLSATDRAYLDEKFANGMYVEGFVTLKAEEENQVNLSVPFLAFYGDWLKAPMFDKTYYEVEADRVDGSISEKDKTKADMIATTPYGKYLDYYMIPLGGYIYEIPAGQDQIAATEDKAAITIDSDNGIYQLYTIYTGMLRGAKKLTMTITKASSGEILYEKITYNNRKATYYGNAGGILPYNENYSFGMFNEETGEIFANNTKLTVKMVAELDYENGEQVANNTFEFSFYVDYETPTLQNVNYVTEYDKATKKNRYYLELDVSDNRYVQAIRPCSISNNTLYSLVDNPIPVYQSKANEATRVKIEITDYFADLKNSDYPDTIFFMINDYALNSNIYLVSLAGCDYEDLAFTQGTIEVEKNEIIDLNEYVNFENATLQGLTWTTSNNEIAIVDEAKVMGLKKGIAVITGTSTSYGVSVQVRIKVLDNNSVNNSYLSKIRFSGYSTLFTFDDDYEYSSLGSISEGDRYSYMPSSNLFEIYPSESFKLRIDIEPWNFDSSVVEVRYTSSNSNYVTVTDDGVVTAVKETISPISIKATAYIDGKETVFSASTTVTVKSPFIHSGIVLQYYKGAGGVVEIPSDLGIEYIGEYAFSHYIYEGLDEDGFAIRKPIGDNTSTPITKIIVPEGVKIIQDYAFSNLTSLQEVVLPSTIRDIYVNAFENCTSLETINLNDVVKIENYAFNNCRSLSNINAANATHGNDLSNVVTMGSYAFNNTSLTKVNLVRLRMAGQYALANCSQLKEVTLYDDNPLNVNLFSSSAIERITIPHANIPKNAFENCASIQEIIFTNKKVSIGIEAFKNCTNLSSVHFENDCTSLYIGYNAFENSMIQSLELPSCLVTIDDEAFKGSQLSTLQLKENTELNLQGTPFALTEQFNQIVLNGTSNFYTIVDNMLLNKTQDTLLLVPSNGTVNFLPTISTIEEGALSGNKNLDTLVIPSTITTIMDFAFAGSSIQKVDFSQSRNCDFRSYLFYGCESLNEVVGLDGLTTIPDYMFAYSGLTHLTIGDNATIGYGAFAYCEDLALVQIGQNVQIGDYAFYHSLCEDGIVNISSGILGDYAFADSNIKQFIGQNVSEIGIGTFMNAKALEEATLPNVLSIRATAFLNCSALRIVDITNATIIEKGAFMKDTALSSVVASCLTTIDAHAFMDCNLLSNINLNQVTRIGAYAFASCYALTSIDLSNVEILDEFAFMECIGLVEVENLENSSLKVIPVGCFYHDSSLETVSSLTTINLSKIEAIGDNAFQGNSNLTTINLDQVLKVGQFAFYGTSLQTLSLANCEKVDAYAFYAVPIRTLNIPNLVTVGECAFAETYASKVDLPSSLTHIHYGAFSSIRYLMNFTHQDEVNYINYDENQQPIWLLDDGVLYVYLENGNLQLQAYPVNANRTSYTVLDGTTRIDAYSFYSSITSVKLTEIYFPRTLQVIGDCAFGGVENLKEYHFASYDAPVLEGVYNYSLQNYMASLQSATDEINALYHITDGRIYNMYYYYYPYYYANFYDYVGFTTDLTMYYPSNGNGYDSWIYRNYFKNKVNNAAVADDATNRAIEALNAIADIEHATIENKDIILDAYNYYIVITDEEQLALLPSEKVTHLLNLYNEIIDMDYPPVIEEELESIKGSYQGVDSEGTIYEFVIQEDGSGTFKVDNQENDNFDRIFTFNKVRHMNETTLQIITDDQNTFTFVIQEDGTVVFKYYVSEVQLNKRQVEPIVPNKSNNHTTLWIVIGSCAIVAIAVGAVMLLIRMKKNKNMNGGKKDE